MLSSITTYDAEGNVIEESRYGPDGSVYERYTASDDGKGTVVIESSRYSGGSAYHERCIRTYDGRGILSHSCYNDNGALTGKELNTYDAQGNLIELASCDERGCFDVRNSYTVDDERTVTATVVYNPDGSIQYRARKVHDPKANEIERFYDRPDGSEVRAAVYRYDARGNWTEWTDYNVDGSIDSKWVYSYDADEIIQKWVKYGHEGSIVEMNVYSYEFDSNGNWTKRTTKKWGSGSGTLRRDPGEVTYRIITYD